MGYILSYNKFTYVVAKYNSILFIEMLQLLLSGDLSIFGILNSQKGNYV